MGGWLEQSGKKIFLFHAAFGSLLLIIAGVLHLTLLLLILAMAAIGIGSAVRVAAQILLSALGLLITLFFSFAFVDSFEQFWKATKVFYYSYCFRTAS